jgi:hypothetical protein
MDARTIDILQHASRESQHHAGTGNPAPTSLPKPASPHEAALPCGTGTMDVLAFFPTMGRISIPIVVSQRAAT